MPEVWRLTVNLDTKKLRGGYYTPRILADYISNKVIRSKNTRILEPSCGDGSILVSIVRRLVNLGARKSDIPNLVLGIEIDSHEAVKAAKKLSDLDIPNSEHIIHSGDFFKYCKSNLLGKHQFDAVLGNPPFIRYQDFPKNIKEIAFELLKNAEINLDGRMNSWVPFLIVSSLLLTPKGSLGMIVPAQLFQVNYAAEARSFLSRIFKKLTIVTFEKIIFQKTLQDVVVLLGEKDNNEHEGIRVVEHKDIGELILNNEKATKVWNDELKFKPLDHTKDKWTQYFLDVEEILLLRYLKENYNLKVCKDVLEVDIGVVTGKNDFFVLSEEDCLKRGLLPYSKRIVGSSSNLKGIQFSISDFSKLQNKSQTWLFNPPDQPFSEMPKPVTEYIEGGRRKGVNKGYKCRIRDFWYKVPTTWVPHAFMLRQVHGYPKIVLNKSDATCTDTIHRVKFKEITDDKKIVSSFMNSLTFAFAEIMGRSYGGGVLTLEPSEAENLPIPPEAAENLDFEKIDSLERQKRIEPILDITDAVLLKDGLQIEEKKIKMLRNIWKKLRDRRFNRNTI